MMNAIEKLAYLPHLPSVKAGSTGRNVIDYAVACAVSNVFVRDILLFPEGRHGTFTKEELVKAVCAEVRPDYDVYNSIDETEFVAEAVNSLIGSEFLNEDSNGISCSYLSLMLVDLWKNQHPKLIDESQDETSEDDEEIPELF